MFYITNCQEPFSRTCRCIRNTGGGFILEVFFASFLRLVIDEEAIMSSAQENQ
ncbi:hypothetical protein CEXT_662881, partial [Caerostris extrusa]